MDQHRLQARTPADPIADAQVEPDVAAGGGAARHRPGERGVVAIDDGDAQAGRRTDRLDLEVGLGRQIGVRGRTAVGR